jgi:hypothetical protein
MSIVSTVSQITKGTPTRQVFSMKIVTVSLAAFRSSGIRLVQCISLAAAPHPGSGAGLGIAVAVVGAAEAVPAVRAEGERCSTAGSARTAACVRSRVPRVAALHRSRVAVPAAMIGEITDVKCPSMRRPPSPR